MPSTRSSISGRMHDGTNANAGVDPQRAGEPRPPARYALTGCPAPCGAAPASAGACARVTPAHGAYGAGNFRRAHRHMVEIIPGGPLVGGDGLEPPTLSV